MLPSFIENIFTVLPLYKNNFLLFNNLHDVYKKFLMAFVAGRFLVFNFLRASPSLCQHKDKAKAKRYL